MKRLVIGICGVALGMSVASSAEAQVFVRAPFVRVQVGGPGVAVRAPFVNLWIPNNYPPPVYYSSRPVYVAPMPAPVELQPIPRQDFPPPPPQPQPQPPPQDPDQAPPEANQPAKALTLQQFANTFQAKPGSYEVTVLNPVTNEPTTVRFNLPEGSPRRVNIRRNEVEFDYGVRRFVRIEFDRDGAQVVSR